ncbi:MAG: DUF6133 family protein [Clostridia bacterium]|nr:DUF6133 family protein [Clostridia bacterium]
MRNTTNKLYINALNEVSRFKTKVMEVLRKNSGEGFVDTAVKILISVVIGALVLGGLYLLFKDTVLPTLTQKIIDMFNFKAN